MTWNGIDLNTREKWETALGSLRDAADISAFLRLLELERPSDAADVMGYMSGELRPAERRRLLPLLAEQGIVHPANPTNLTDPLELIVAGMTMAVSERPTWLDYVMSIPRTSQITCPMCGMTSFNPNDVAKRYCGNCHRFLEDA